MRIVIHLNDYEPEDDDIVHDRHCVDNPEEAADDRAVLPGVDTEWYPGGGNIHLLDARVTEVSEMMDGTVLVRLGDDENRIENAELVTVYSEGPARDDA